MGQRGGLGSTCTPTRPATATTRAGYVHFLISNIFYSTLVNADTLLFQQHWDKHHRHGFDVGTQHCTDLEIAPGLEFFGVDTEEEMLSLMFHMPNGHEEGYCHIKFFDKFGCQGNMVECKLRRAEIQLPSVVWYADEPANSRSNGRPGHLHRDLCALCLCRPLQ